MEWCMVLIRLIVLLADFRLADSHKCVINKLQKD